MTSQCGASQKVFHEFESPVGRLRLIGSDAGLHSVLWGKARNNAGDASLRRDPSHPLMKKTERQLREYFAGKRKSFDLPLAPEGTAFQRRAWRVLRAIPYGRTISYQDQARRLGDAKKARAVGGANGKNPLSIVVPCHRVVGKNGSLTGFGGGLGVKRYLLDLERNL